MCSRNISIDRNCAVYQEWVFLATFSGWINLFCLPPEDFSLSLSLFCERLTWLLCLLKPVSDLHRFQRGAHGWDRSMQSQSTAYQQNQQRGGGGGGGWRPPHNQQDSRRGGQQQVWSIQWKHAGVKSHAHWKLGFVFQGYGLPPPSQRYNWNWTLSLPERTLLFFYFMQTLSFWVC